MSPDISTASRLTNELKDYFGAATEDEGTPKTSQEAERIRPDSAKAPTLKLHLYKREPKKAVIAQGLFKQQKGLCAWSKSGGGVCDGEYFELDHINGDPDDWAWENLQLLCEHHHRTKSNFDRAERRRSAGVSVKTSKPRPDLTARSTWTSKEGQKAEWSRPEFDRWIADPKTWLELGAKIGMDLKLGEEAYLADLLDFGADSINDPDYPEGVSQETLRRYVKARRFSTLKLGKMGHRVTVRYIANLGVQQKVEELVR